MRFTVENFLTLTCVLASLASSFSESRVCGDGDRPHERGLCGWRLAQAHSNLCFLLREVYHRDHYQSEGQQRSRRSSGGDSLMDARTLNLVRKIYSIPLDELAELDLTQYNWQGLLGKKSFDPDTPLYAKKQQSPQGIPAKFRSNPFYTSFQREHKTGDISSRLIQLLLQQGREQTSKAPSSAGDVRPEVSRSRRSAVSGMVCDCCYNQCTPEELGTYC